MLEEQSLVASFARGELGEKLDLANLDALSRLPQEIKLTLWRSPGVDVHHLDFVVAVASALRVGALAVKVGSDGLMPREISISRVVVRHTLVLQLEWEPVIGANLRRGFVCRLVNGASLRGRSIYIFEECRSDDGCRIRSIASLKHLLLLRLTHAVCRVSSRFLWEASHSALERVSEEVPGAITSKAFEAWHAKQVFGLLPVHEHLNCN